MKTRNVLHFLQREMRQMFSWLRYGRSRRFPFGCVVIRPIIYSVRYISLGRNVFIRNGARVQAVTCHNNRSYTPLISIGADVNIEQNLHLTCANKIVIEKNTAIAANVTITDIDHPYTDVNISVERHNLVVKEVVIGENSKIYNNAVILPGVHIGKHCVVGANSVVTKDVPDFCVVVGAPARIVKQYNCALKAWVTLEQK